MLMIVILQLPKPCDSWKLIINIWTRDPYWPSISTGTVFAKDPDDVYVDGDDVGDDADDDDDDVDDDDDDDGDGDGDYYYYCLSLKARSVVMMVVGCLTVTAKMDCSWRFPWWCGVLFERQGCLWDRARDGMLYSFLAVNEFNEQWPNPCLFAV